MFGLESEVSAFIWRIVCSVCMKYYYCERQLRGREPFLLRHFLGVGIAFHRGTNSYYLSLFPLCGYAA